MSYGKDYDYDYEPDHFIWYKSDADQMLRDGIITEEEYLNAEIIDDSDIHYDEDAC